MIQKDKNHVSNMYGDYVDEEGNVVQRNVDVTKDRMPEDADGLYGSEDANCSCGSPAGMAFMPAYLPGTALRMVACGCHPRWLNIFSMLPKSEPR